MSKFNKDLTKVPYNRILLLEWLYAGVVGDAMHCMGYKEKGDGRWHWDDGAFLDETITGWVDTYELMYD